VYSGLLICVASALVIKFLRTKLVPMMYYRVKSRVQMFYFDSKKCVPLLKLSSPELAF